MTGPVVETVTFTLNAGTSREAFVRAAEAMNAWVAAQPGFVRRRLSRTEEGTWIEHIEWESMEAARAAAAGIGAAPDAGPFVSAIDGPSVVLHHSALEVALG